jgi:hypothetical protein
VAYTTIRKKEIDIMDFEFEDMNDGDSDILLRMEHEDGTHITFLTAHPSAFTEQDVLEPLITELDTKQIYVAFNGELLEKLIQESVEKNSETYGKKASAFLPLSLIINTGIHAVDEYMNKRKDK